MSSSERFRVAEQLLKLMVMLRSRRHLGVTIDEIAEAFGVSRKTAGRMRDAIGRLDPSLDFRWDDERQKRWYLGEVASLDAGVSAGELADLETAARHLEQAGLDNIAISVRSSMERARAALRRRDLFRIDPDLELLGESVGIAHRPGPRPKIDKEIVEMIRRAILESRRIVFTYAPTSGEAVTRRSAEPYGFLLGHRHYLVANDPRQGEVRNFALGGITDLKILDEVFERPETFDMRVYAARSFGVFHDGKPIEVELVFKPEAARDVMDYEFHPSQTIETLSNGEVRVRFVAESELEIARECMIWRDRLANVQPARLLPPCKT